MLSKKFDILTPLVKLHRVSRPILDSSTFEIEPGLWVCVANQNKVEGAVVKVDDATYSTKVFEMAISPAIKSGDDLYMYEANDVKVGRISTISEPGTRVWVGSAYVAGVTAVGDKVTVDTSTAGKIGTMVATTGTDAVAVVSAIGSDGYELKLV